MVIRAPLKPSVPLSIRGFSVILVVILIVVAVGLVALTAMFLQRPAGNRATNDQSIVNSGQAESAPVDRNPTRPIQDTDADGLTDEEEIQLGTSPGKPDSDNDELLDFDEVKLYGSNPNKSDSDGDGFSDGSEVKRQFSPTGPGPLFPPNPASENPAPR